MTLNETYQEINNITLKLVEFSLSIQQNFPFRSGSNIECKENGSVSAILKNITYQEKYQVLDKDKNFNIKLIDGALIQFMYSFNSTGRTLLRHRLAYFPAPHLENYEDDPISYEEDYFGGSEFHDVIEDNIVKSPIRFDFESNETIYKPVDHPYCHLHVGEYNTCRIPVVHPLTPSEFINFILRNFYNTALKEYCDDYSFPISRHGFEPTIADEEKKLIYISCDAS
ncbi:DUF2290 domain-containing protein [Ekhidna sp.]|uniref:DUF2290 domain-containing protein n=1 Tax=Ekhidna sp. TaxID=2608089 RepID=UPI003C7DBF38